ncbi:hypothetical protein BD410DRAFT_845692, partial [Rickenella mellea]
MPPNAQPEDSGGRRATRSSTKAAASAPLPVPKPRGRPARPATKATVNDETPIATTADAAADAGVPAPNLADKAPARGKAKSVRFFLSLFISNKLYNMMDSVQRAAADQAAEDAGTQTKLTRTERSLKESGVSVAPPPRARSPTATIPPPPPAKGSTKRVRDDGSGGGKSK